LKGIPKRKPFLAVSFLVIQTSAYGGEVKTSNLFNLLCCAVVASCLFTLPAFGTTSHLPEGTITRYAASYNGVTYHYDLYVPQGYNADPEKYYPVIFICSPGGNAVMGNMEGWIKAHRWLAVMLVEARNGPSDINDANFYAAHDNVVKRARIGEKRKYVTGLSGGARMAARFAVRKYRSGIHGLFLQAAGSTLIYYEHVIRPDLYIFASFGNTDFNLYELDYMLAAMPPHLFNYEVFIGGHEWAPVPTAERALTWLNEQVEQNITEAVDNPLFSPQPGTYTTSQTVTLSCATPSATIHYTTDGSAPTESSLLYSAPIAISETTTLKAKAYKYKSGLAPSDTVTGLYTIVKPMPWIPLLLDE
jgi:hypothetical protein